jgi:selenocysteine lyase/cysteine desulfurase
LVLGGTGSNSESEEMPAWLPDRLEAGTPNGPGIVGLGAACGWLADRGVQAVADHEHELADHLVAGLGTVAGVTVVGRDHGGPTTGIVSFSIAGVDMGDAATRLDRDHGVMLRAGLHCAPAAHRRLGTFPEGTLRASVGPLTTAAEIDALVAGVRAVSRAVGLPVVGAGGSRG